MKKALLGDLAPQAVATRDEQISAWKALTAQDKKALAAFAARLAQTYQFADQGMTWEDLMQDAALKVVKGRRTWDMKRISFKEFLFGVLRSVARDLARTKAGRLRAASVHDDEAIAAVSDEENPEDTLIEREREAAMQAHIASLQIELKDDGTALLVLECMREGLKPREIRERLKMSERDFDAARKKITRRSLKLQRSN